MRKLIKKIFKLFRAREWVVTKFLFNTAIIMGYFYLSAKHPEGLIISILLYLLYMLSMGSFAYLINDISDRKFDEISGKKRIAASLSDNQRFVLITTLFILSFVPGIFVSFPLIYILLIASQIIFILLYSLPLTRLKKNTGGLLCDSMYSFVLPGLVALLLSFDKAEIQFNTAFLFFVLWLFFQGLRGIISHQSGDIESDILSGQKTFVRSIGLRNAGIIKIIVSALELLAFVILLSLLQIDLIYGIFISILLFVLIEVISEGVSPARIFSEKINELVNQYYNYYLLIAISFAYVLGGNFWFISLPAIFLIYRFHNWLYYRFKSFFKWTGYRIGNFISLIIILRNWFIRIFRFPKK